MTKKLLRLVVPLCIAALVAIPFFFLSGGGGDVPGSVTLTPSGVEAALPSPSDVPAVSVPDISDDFRGVWVSTLINLDYPSRTGLGDDELKREADEVLDRCAALGFNAVLFQVRPSGDALYESDIFPWSEYVSGTQGEGPGFDLLEYWTEGAHARGMQLHAWINPYRVARNSHDLSALAESNPARRHPEWVVMHTDGHMYLDPGIEGARELVVDGVREICKNYDVDGIHFDDYFYPDGGLDDAATYAASGSSLSLEDWRRENINTLIREVREVTREYGKTFGVSPFGIWANASSVPGGSDTNGNQSYLYHFADTKKWVEERWLDYICPQIYWEIGYAPADYKTLVEWWSDVVQDTGVRLYVGHASYRSGAENGAWSGTGELRRQLTLNRETEEVSGSIHFRYKFFVDYAPLGTFIASWNAMESLPEDYPLLDPVEWDGGISVGRPSGDITVGYSEYYVLGRCDPNVPLYLNGTQVEEVTESGYFGVLVKLDSGENRLRFTQGEREFTRVITRGGSAAVPTPLESASIVAESTYPSEGDIYVAPGEKITFRCTAPIGASLSVTISGETFRLTPAATEPPAKDGKVYGTNYFNTYTVSDGYPSGRVSTVGRPVYTMIYNGRTETVSARGMLCCIGDGAPFYATVTSDAAFIYPGSTTSGGPVGELCRGMTDYVTAVTTNGAWVRLRSGYWAESDGLELSDGEGALSSGLSAAEYEFGDGWDYLRFKVSSAALSTVDYTGASVTVRIHYSGVAPALALPQGSLFTSCAQWSEDGSAYYRLTLRDRSLLDGYIFEYDESSGTLSLALKRRPVLKEGALPLEGLTILLDPGHGGSELGALGPLGEEMSERVLVLAIAKKVGYELERLGATVEYLRSDDSTVDLHGRLVTAREMRPDLLLSIHLNAIDENVDATNIRGVSTWYREDISEEYSETLTHYVAEAFGLYDRGANQSNLYICRGTFCPSTIVECGFVCCPSEFEWLANDADEARFARALADAVCEYFR